MAEEREAVGGERSEGHAADDAADPMVSVIAQEAKADAGPEAHGRLAAAARPVLRKRRRRNEMLAVYEELALLLEYGTPLPEALRLVAERAESRATRAMLEDVRSSVAAGSSFAEAIADYPAHFPPAVVSMVSASEQTGTLAETLDRLATHGEKLEAAHHRVATSLIYPAIVLLLAIVAVGFAFSFAVEAFQPVLDATGREMPWTMDALITASGLFRTWQFWVIALCVIIVAVIAWKLAMRIPACRLVRDRILLWTPIVRRYLRESLVASFSRVFSTMVLAGVKVRDALSAARDATDNEVLRRAVDRAEAAAERGGPITEEFERAGVFPPVVYDLAAIGEESDELGEVFQRLADVYEEKLETDAEAVSKAVTPIFIIGLGLVVGFIAVSLFGTYSTIIEGIATEGGLSPAP